MLDFLTFWLKQEASSYLFVLYARTTQRLEQESKILINNSTLEVRTHPSRMTKEEMRLFEMEQEEAGEIVDEELPV
jgi:hypothetical protein